MELQRPNRTRTRNLVIRLTDGERAMLDDIAEHHHLPSVSEAFRFLVHREHGVIPATKKKRHKPSK
jgi:hypothetical protein